MADPYNPQQLSSFQDAAARTDAQKRALLDAVASGGQAGAQAYQQAQAQAQQARMDALAGAYQAAQNSPLTLVQGGLAAPERPVQQDAAIRQADLGQAQQTLQNDLARQQASGEQFFSRMQQAIPITEARTRMGVEQIIRQQQEAEAQRALEMQMAQLQLQAQRESIAADREAREFARQQREANGGLDPLQQAQLSKLVREERDAQRLSVMEDILAGFAGGDPMSPTWRAIERLINGGSIKLDQLDPSIRRDVISGAYQYFRAVGEEPPASLVRLQGANIGFGDITGGNSNRSRNAAIASQLAGSLGRF